jgi:phosphate starvation-inducible membrane PsiE
MIPEEVFKRRPRHNNTPQSVLLIIANFIVVAVAVTFFTDKYHISWFFWVVIALLALYNFFTIRRNREEFTKSTIISFAVSIIALILLVILFKGKA